jgi:hypothetical protein
VGWLTLAALGLIWAIFLIPSTRRLGSSIGSVEDFERNMELLGETRQHGEGRWIVTPRKGEAFLGPSGRAQARARERRRRVLTFLLETIGLTFLIGLVPPLHAIWSLTAVLVVALGAYIWLLVWMKQQTAEAHATQRVQDANVPQRPSPVRERYVSEGPLARPSFNGLGAFPADDDLTNIVVRPARRVRVAGA